MLDKIVEALGLVYREEWALRGIFSHLHEMFTGFSVKGFFAGLMAVVELFGMLVFGLPTTPRGQELDLTGYELVFYDEFEGDTLNYDNWYHRGEGAQNGGYSNLSQVSLRDGNVVLTGEYREDGAYGPGWYGADIARTQWYTNGYFEIRCICSSGEAFWSAFWLQAHHPYEAEYSQGGIGGAELDIFECFSKPGQLFGGNSVTSTIHCAGVNGVQEGFQSAILGDFKGRNIFEEYNTYGLEWTQDEYIFYINGVETTRSTFGNGVSREELLPIISLCVPSASKLDGVDKDYKTEYIVDYVKIYQK